MKSFALERFRLTSDWLLQSICMLLRSNRHHGFSSSYLDILPLKDRCDCRNKPKSKTPAVWNKAKDGQLNERLFAVVQQNKFTLQVDSNADCKVVWVSLTTGRTYMYRDVSVHSDDIRPKSFRCNRPFHFTAYLRAWIVRFACHKHRPVMGALLELLQCYNIECLL